MKTVTIQEFAADRRSQELAGRILRENDGLVCFPCSGTYRLAASLLSESGVLGLLQAKRRAKKKPALVMVANTAMLYELVQDVSPRARQAIDALWPGDVTLRLPLSEDLPRKVYRELSRLDRKVGVRLPANPVAELLVNAAGVPLLVSSANVSRKAGAASVAAIKRSFSRSLSLFIDAGDLPDRPPSTVVDFDGDGGYQVVRAGAVSEEAIRQALER